MNRDTTPPPPRRRSRPISARRGWWTALRRGHPDSAAAPPCPRRRIRRGGRRVVAENQQPHLRIARRDQRTNRATRSNPTSLLRLECAQHLPAQHRPRRRRTGDRAPPGTATRHHVRFRHRRTPATAADHPTRYRRRRRLRSDATIRGLNSGLAPTYFDLKKSGGRTGARGRRRSGQLADLDQVVGDDADPGPDPGAFGAVGAAVVPPVAALERADPALAEVGAVSVFHCRWRLRSPAPGGPPPEHPGRCRRPRAGRRSCPTPLFWVSRLVTSDDDDGDTVVGVSRALRRTSTARQVGEGSWASASRWRSFPASTLEHATGAAVRRLSRGADLAIGRTTRRIRPDSFPRDLGRDRSVRGDPHRRRGRGEDDARPERHEVWGRRCAGSREQSRRAASRWACSPTWSGRRPPATRSGSWPPRANPFSPTGRSVIGVDDAHLLDQLSATLLHQLAMDGAVRIVATVRSGEVGAGRDHLAVERRLPATAAPDAVHQGQCVGLIEPALGGRVEGLSADLMWEASGGNALFVRHLVEGALEAGTLRQVRGVWQLRGRTAVTSELASLLDGRSRSTARRCAARAAAADLLRAPRPGHAHRACRRARPSRTPRPAG